MAGKIPKLTFTPEEKSNLRKAQVKLSEVYLLETDDLAHHLNAPNERAKYIKALATFQQIPSIGHKFADTLVNNLNFYNLDDLTDKNGAALLDQLERDLGYWVDPCVEDQIRCVIYHANHPGSTKQWFDFTRERKTYREKNGYPESRPVDAWY
ncbi:helix-hairpin-helix domain-containing protein [Lentibacillus amyloliquefaciens]|uniref:Pathogenicity locus n=1 Tax=Lentibacillus amyloliquefaciens TaxID=1472767 RepID=A0A0U4DW76_9BACI|nr:helix-hairpin-helix domain-containing protein [Lentibacillus amyloliquefaciens]ALX49624.1 Pathogenicity locus [Lentibacillus amyloliquefaciens]